MSRRKSLQGAFKDLSILYGLPPYDGPGNICLHDAYFARSIEQKYHTTLPKLRKAVNFDIRWMERQNIRRGFVKDRVKL